MSGGAGGGAIRLNVGGNLVLEGSLTANGTGGGSSSSSGNAGGGGSGGSVWLTAGILTGNGRISAEGSSGGNASGGGYGGGGAGGRIALYLNTNVFTGKLSAIGGSGYGSGGAGTIFVKLPSGAQGGLYVDNGGNSAGETLLPPGTNIFDTVQVVGRGVLSIGSNGLLHADSITVLSNSVLLLRGLLQTTVLRLRAGGKLALNPGGSVGSGTIDLASGGIFALNTSTVLSNLTIQSGGVLTHDPGISGFALSVTGDLTVESGAMIVADSLGYASDSGPGAGQAEGGLINHSGGGAGHGGLGGSSQSGRAGGQIYGSIFSPVSLGSGGGTGGAGSGYDVSGGVGGGVVRLNVNGNLVLNGSLTANGTGGGSSSFSGNAGGGGSGGSVWLTAGTLTGNGRISAEGGNGGNASGGGYGGGGAGGRIALYVTYFSYGGLVSANGGIGFRSGELGTYYTPPMVLPNPESFESGWGGWWQDGTLWNVRRPGNGPGNAYSGTNAVCGNSGGSYAVNSQGRLISPRFIVPSVSGDDRVILRFWQWYQYGTGDAGLVQISTPYETNWTTLTVAATNETSSAWTLATVDLTQFQGQEVRVAFYYTANSDGSVGAGWFIDDVSLSQSTPTRIVLNTPSIQQFTANGQSQYFLVTAPAGGHLRVRLMDADHLGINEVYVRRGSLPGAGSYDYRYNVSGGADQSIFVPNAGAGDWFIQAYNDSGPVPGNYTLEVDFTTGVLLDRLSPAKVGNSLPGSVTINGAGFTPSDSVALVGASTYPASNVFFISASQLIADFNFPAIPTNSYQLRVTSGTNSDSLPFELIAGFGAKLETHLTVPSRVGRHAPATIYIEYANTGDAPMPAPLLVLTGTQRPILSPIIPSPILTVWYARGFWTSAEPLGWSQTVQVFASGAGGGILQPGESNTVAIAYAGLVQPWDFSQTTVRFDLGVLTVTNATLVDWNALKPTMKPASVPADAWDALWSNFLTQVGTTWGDYVRMLDDNAAYLRTVGLDVKDLNSLLAFSFAQADGLNVIRTLASSTDAYVPTPGLRLSFERFFPQSISGRFRTNALGRGWAHNWEIGLAEAGDGTVTVTGPGGSRRVFQPDSRYAGVYFSEAGDHGTLSKSSGIYTLTEPRGLKRVFASDGKLSYVEDPNGNRITTTFSGGLLTGLTHSSGQNLSLTYTGNLLQSVTDSVGRTTTFSYAGEHLQTAHYYDGSEVSYTYAPVASPNPQAHALTQIAYPGGTHEFFSYDANGRLASLSRDAGSEPLTFTYGSGGEVDVADAFTNTTRFYLDHRGLLAKAQNPLNNILRLDYDTEFNLTSLTDPAGRSYQYSYDANGNLTQMADPLGAPTRFGYGALNRLATLVDAKGNLTRYTHDVKGSLAAIAYADNSVERWGYDTIGNPITWTNRRANGISYVFNTNGQLAAKLFPDGSRADYAYDPRGSLAFASNYVGAITLEYYTNDRLRRITYPSSRWLEYTYDVAGHRKTMTDQLGYTLYYNYDAPGRLMELTNNAGTRLVLYEYDAAGRLWRKTLGNGVCTTNAYDHAGQLVSLVNRKPDGSLLSRFDYTYDSRGRRITIGTHYGAWTYRYDDLGQLTNAVLISTDTNIPNQNLDYSYDALGNRVRTVENGMITDYTANNLNQYTQIGSLTLKYDADGSLTQKVAGAILLTITNNLESRTIGFGSTNGTRHFKYDSLGFPSEVWRDGVPNYQVHDPFGLGDLTGIYDDGGGLIQRRNHGFGLTTADSTGQILAPTFDALGNLSELTDTGGAVLKSVSYRPFGDFVRGTGGFQERFAFGSELGVEDEGPLLNMRARFYDPQQGRFTVEDPLGLGSGDLNSFRYCLNVPTVLIDPDGLGSFESPWQGDKARRKMEGARDLTIARYFNSFFFNLQTIASKIPNPFKNPFSKPEAKQSSPAGQPTDPGNKEPGGPESGFGDNGSSGGGTGGGGGGGFGNMTGGFLCDRFPFLPWCNPNNSGSSQTAQASDPNTIAGPAGYGTANFISANSLLPYTINFENQTNATAPAQQVFITDPLTNTLDWQTFELTEIAFGDHFIAVPPETQHFQKTEKVRYNDVDFEVQIEAGIHLANGQVYATFRSIVADTGLPPTVDVGFLPPENGTGRGQGHIGYIIRAVTNVTTGAEIRNVATIQFDYNPALRTDLVDPQNPGSGIDTNKQALVTIDADAPTSMATGPGGTATNAIFMVSWAGSDVGSGIATYDLYVQTNGGPWNPWLAGFAGNSAVFPGQNGRAYGFYSVAHDGAGNVEAKEPSAEATTTTLSNYPPVIDPVTNRFVLVGQHLVVTNVASDPDVPVTFSLGPGAPAGASITSGGVFTWSPACAQGSTTNTIAIVATDSGTPPLSSTNTFIVTVPECIQASVGSTVMQTGHTSSVPVLLLSTVALTNMVFTVPFPADRLTNFAITVNSAQVLTQRLQLLDASNVQVSFILPGSSVLHGPTNVGQLSFAAVSNQSSAFVTLPIKDVTGVKPDGGLAGNTSGVPGRVTIIGREPLLEAWLSTNRQRMLALYGNPGASYQMNLNTNLVATNWSFVLRVPLKNLFEIFEANEQLQQVFYRAFEFGADPPVLEIVGSGGNPPTLLLYGRTGTNYVIQKTTNLAVMSSWLPLTNFTLTNSFRFIGIGSPTNGRMFFRAVRQ